MKLVGKKKSIFISAVVLIIASILSAVFFIVDIDGVVQETKVFEFLTCITAILGVVGLISSSNEQNELNEAEFIVRINTKYIDHEEYQNLLYKIENKEVTSFEEIENDVTQLFDFFEPIYILISKKIIKWDVINDLFCYRFFTVVNCELVQQEIFDKKKEFYENIIMFHKEWKEYRDKRGLEIPFFETDLSKRPWYAEYTNKRHKSTNKSHKDNISATRGLNVRRANKADSYALR